MVRQWSTQVKEGSSWDNRSGATIPMKVRGGGRWTAPGACARSVPTWDPVMPRAGARAAPDQKFGNPWFVMRHSKPDASLGSGRFGWWIEDRLRPTSRRDSFIGGSGGVRVLGGPFVGPRSRLAVRMICSRSWLRAVAKS